MEWKPNKWIAAILGFVGQYFGLLYVGRVKWAIGYFIVQTVVLVSELAVRASGVFPWLEYFSFNLVLMFVCAVHAYRIAVHGTALARRPWYSKWYGLSAIFLVPILAIFLFRSFVYEPYRFPSGSMLPTIKLGSYLIVQKWGYGHYGSFGISVLHTPISAEIHRGDLIVFDFPRDPTIQYSKRVIGLPGDIIELHGRQLTVNGSLVESQPASPEPDIVAQSGGPYEAIRETLGDTNYTVAYTKSEEGRKAVFTIPADHYFVLGDNRDHSNDSRYWGFLPARNVVGKVVFIYQ